MDFLHEDILVHEPFHILSVTHLMLIEAKNVSSKRYVEQSIHFVASAHFL
jgi:hypothetical protein